MGEFALGVSEFELGVSVTLPDGGDKCSSCLCVNQIFDVFLQWEQSSELSPDHFFVQNEIIFKSELIFFFRNMGSPLSLSQ